MVAACSLVDVLDRLVGKENRRNLREEMRESIEVLNLYT